MPRELVIGNGRILINFDSGLNIRDFYYPYVGQWNHIGGYKFSFGFKAESHFTWCDDPSWNYKVGYKPHSLVTQVEGENQKLGLSVQINDAVHYRDNIYLKHLNVRNHYGYGRTILVFFTHDFSIEESDVGDTAVYDPFLNTLYHYKRNFYFMVNGRAQNRGFYQFATGVKRFRGAEGTWRDEVQLPIQEDETALVLVSLWEHYRHRRDLEFLQTLYRTMVEPAADGMSDYILEDLDLPQPSYDLWEEKRGIWTFTASTVFAALLAASHIARLFADYRKAGRYRNTADRLRRGILRHLYSEELGRFLKGLVPGPAGTFTPDCTPESSILGLSLFRVLLPHDPRLRNTVKALEESLWVAKGVGGMARYPGDAYFLPSAGDQVQGNPWIICTLWLAQYYIAAARSRADLNRPLELLSWVAGHASRSGILPEQVDALTGQPLSVAPLTWSHSTFVETVLRYRERYRRLVRLGQGPERSAAGEAE